MSTVFKTIDSSGKITDSFVRAIEHGFTTWRELDGTLIAIAVDENGLRRALNPSEKETAIELGIIKPKV